MKYLSEDIKKLHPTLPSKGMSVTAISECNELCVQIDDQTSNHPEAFRRYRVMLNRKEVRKLRWVLEQWLKDEY